MCKMMGLIVCCIALAILKISASPSNSTIYDKFHQTDFKLKFERLEAVSFNKDCLKRLEIVTFKYNRTCAAANLTIESNFDFDNHLEMIVQSYKFLSNEYRYFPLRIQINVCSSISKNIAGLGKFVGHCGNFSGCLFPKGKLIHICKWTPDESMFPPLIPNGMYMQEFQLVNGSTEIAVLRAYAEIFRPIV